MAANGTNTLTAIARDILGRADTNVVTAYLPTNSVLSTRQLDKLRMKRPDPNELRSATMVVSTVL